MKKFFCLMAMAIAAVTFTACSESDSEAVFSVDPSVSEGIVAELDGGFYKIPITANQGWSARLEDGCNWASLSDAEGKGSGSIEVCVDANYTGTGRKTNVLISSGDKVVTVPVSQRTPDENDEDFYNIAQNKGLGYGFDLSSFKNGEVMIFNLKAIQKLVEQDELEYDGMFTSDVINDFMADDIHVDSVEEKDVFQSLQGSTVCSYVELEDQLYGNPESLPQLGSRGLPGKASRWRNEGLS